MDDPGTPGTKLRENAVGVPHIIFFVIAAAAPLTAAMGATPAAFSLGNGPGVPGTFLLVGAMYLLFSVGFTAMTRFVNSAGGFYSYISSGLGRRLGVAGAFITIFSYNVMDVSIYALFGVFANQIIRSAGGPDVNWFVCATVFSIVVCLCGRRNIEFSGGLLGICMIAEVAILLVLGAVILVSGGGPQGITVSSYGPSAIFSHGFGIGLVFAAGSFMGFEATAIFGEEAKDPKRSIPVATYLAVTLIALFYTFVTWTVSLNYGASHIAAQATAHTATLYLDVIHSQMGWLAADIVNVLLLTSMFACGLSFHNTANRYFFALGRDRLLWSGLAKTHPRHQSPSTAGLCQTVLILGTTALFALVGVDPYVAFALMAALASLGIMTVQTLVSAAVVGYFARDRRGVGLWRGVVAPILSIGALGATVVLVVDNLPLLSGSGSWVVRSFPIIVAGVGVVGWLFASWLKRTRPSDVYANLGQSFGVSQLDLDEVG